MTPPDPLRVLGDPAFANVAYNPYTSLLYRNLVSLGVEVSEFSPERLSTGQHAIWHVHWPEKPLVARTARSAVKRMIAQSRLFGDARRLGTKIVWTTHNVRSHDQYHPRLERFFWRDFIPRVDGFLSPSKAAYRAALERFPSLGDVPGFVVPHGHYRDVNPHPIDRLEARRALGFREGERIIVYFGLIRRYKNVDGLLREFRRVEDPDTFLLIVGKPESPGSGGELQAMASDDPRVRLDFRLLPSDTLQRYVRASDLVVLPYRNILNSGSALLALSLDRPILVPSLGALVELRDTVGEDWVRTYAGELTHRELSEGLRWGIESTRTAHAPLGTLDWEHLAARTLEAYEAICRHAGTRTAKGERTRARLRRTTSSGP